MAWAGLRDVGYDDEEIYDRSKGMPDGVEPPEYPPGLQFSVACADLEKAGVENPRVGDKGRFTAMGEVTSTYEDANDCRIELELKEFGGEDGKLFDLSRPAHICLTSAELEKLGLDSDCERGDTIHLIGTARVESAASSEFMGDTACLQIIELTYEDESAEARG